MDERGTGLKQHSIREASDVRTIRPSDPATIELLQFVEAAGIREACEFDLLLFFARHPRVVLRTEQIATYVGHEVQHVARALEQMLAASLLKQGLSPGAGGTMYVLAADHLKEWLEPVRRLCATPDGRHALRTLLKERQSQSYKSNGSGQHA
jgi:hypothetical protein